MHFQTQQFPHSAEAAENLSANEVQVHIANSYSAAKNIHVSWKLSGGLSVILFTPADKTRVSDVN